MKPSKTVDKTQKSKEHKISILFPLILPYERKITLLLFLLVSSFNTTAQTNIQLPKLDSLKGSLFEYYHQKQVSEEAEFLVLEKGKGWKYVPTVGFTFGLPSVSWNSNKVYQMKKDKATVEAKLKSIALKNQLAYESDLRKLTSHYRKYQSEKQHLQFIWKQLELETEIFAIYKEAYEKKEISPLAYLEKKKQYLAFEEKYRMGELKVEEVGIRVLELGKQGAEEEVLGLK